MFFEILFIENHNMLQLILPSFCKHISVEIIDFQTFVNLTVIKDNSYAEIFARNCFRCM